MKQSSPIILCFILHFDIMRVIKKEGRKQMKKKRLGIVGGMGPLASAYLYQRIVELTDAKQDQDHIPMIIDNQVLIPDRTAFLQGLGEDPYPSLLASCQGLEKQGVDGIILACNTAHYWVDELQTQLQIPIIHMMKEVVQEIKDNPSLWDGLGVLGTEGLKLFSNYRTYLKEEGIACFETTRYHQEQVSNIIYAIKAKGITPFIINQFLNLIEELHLSGWNHFILGCTELATLEPFLKPTHSYINSVDILAKHTIQLLGYPLKRRNK